jgi:hypothetical protein
MQNMTSISTSHKSYSDRLVLTRNDVMCVLGCETQELKELWGKSLIAAQKAPKSK